MVTVLLVAEALQRSVVVPVGEQVRVEVEDISTTGYRWKLTAYDPAVLTLEKRELAPGRLPGASGLAIFDFRAVGRGRTELRLRLERPWEGDSRSPLRQASVKVEVE
jgi:predicted secreted protein